MSDNTTEPRVAIILLNWNGLYDTRHCLASLSKCTYKNKAIFVVDNASKNPELQVLQQEFPYIRCFQNTENIGFSAGNNVAIRQALKEDFEYILLLNNDTIVESTFLSLLVKEAESDQNIGIVGPKLLLSNGKIQIDSARRFPRLIDQFYMLSYLTTFGRIFLGGKLFGRHYMFDVNKDNTMDVDMVSGASMLIRKSVFLQIGLYDEEYFLFGEDMDFCFRARQYGYRIRYVPLSSIVHLQGQSMKRLPTKHYLNLFKNDYLYYRKNYSLNEAEKYKQLVRFWIWPHLLVDSLFELFRTNDVKKSLAIFVEVSQFVLRWSKVSV